MPDIGFFELLLIGLIAFLVLGPERMPELFGQIGALVRKARSLVDQARAEMDAGVHAVRAPVEEARDAVVGEVEAVRDAILDADAAREGGQGSTARAEGGDAGR